MADTRPTRLSFLAAARLCVLLLFAPRKFKDAERDDQNARKQYTDHEEPVHRADIVRAAFWKSLCLVLAFSALGYGAGKLMHLLGRCATAETIAWAQVGGAALLLWGTLFVRGWEIQSWSGAQLTERVNQWLYRTLYCLGTAVVVYSLSFPQCRA
jgi:hypothetical protein